MGAEESKDGKQQQVKPKGAAAKAPPPKAAASQQKQKPQPKRTRNAFLIDDGTGNNNNGAIPPEVLALLHQTDTMVEEQQEEEEDGNIDALLAQHQVEIAKVLKGSEAEDEVGEVSVHSSDFNDEDLMGELAEVAEEVGVDFDEEVDVVDDGVGPSNELRELEGKRALLLAEAAELEERVAAKKRETLQLNKSGDKPAALASLKELKQMQSQQSDLAHSISQLEEEIKNKNSAFFEVAEKKKLKKEQLEKKRREREMILHADPEALEQMLENAMKEEEEEEQRKRQRQQQQQQSKKKMVPSPPQQKQQPPTLPSATSSDATPHNNTAVSNLEQALMAKKREAYELNKAGDRNGAVAALRASKAIESQIQQMKNQNPKAAEAPPPPASTTPSSMVGVKRQVGDLDGDVARLRRDIAAKKKEALALRAAGDKQGAFKCLQQLKVLEEALKCLT